jgi:protocatechuate 3,4-dioxygenase beta subunit
VIDETTREPVEAFDVEAGIRFTQALRDENGRPLRQHPQGRVRLDDLRPAGDGELVTIHVRAPGYADLHQECKLTQGQDLDLGPLAFRRVPRVLVHVTDARTGDPIAGARVTLSKDEGGQGFVSNRRIEVSSAAEDITNGLSFGERTAVTDEKGDAVLSSFEGETCVLGVEAEGFARSERAGLALPNGRDFEQSFALTGGGDVLVRVFDAEGNPMPGAKVRHRSTSSTPLPFAPTQATDGEGKARFGGLEPGVHGFQLDESKSQGFVLDFGGGGGAGEGWTEVEVREDSLAEVELHALPRADLAGTIREGGTALVGARVSLSEARPGGRERMMMPFGGGEQTRTDGHGEYRFSDIRAGRYTLTIDHTSRAMPSEFEVEVREGDTTYDVDLPVSILEGRVTDRQGNGLAGLAVRAERVREDGHVTAQFVMITMTSDNDGDTVTLGDGSSAAGARTDADGRYSLRGVASDVELVVKASGDTVQAGQSERVTVAPDQTRSNVNIELDPAGSVEVEALQADNSAARMCLVQATYKGEGQVEPRSGLIESRSTKLTGLRPGLWRLTVERIGFGSPAEGDDKGQDVEVVAGETVRATLYVE